MSKYDGKTEAPTAKKKRDARRDGRVAHVPDLVAWISVLVATAVLPSLIARTATATREMLASAAQVARKPDPAAVPAMMGAALQTTLTVMLPALLAFFAIALVGSLAQVGFILTGKPLQPKASRLNPLAGLKRMLSVKGLWQALSASMKLTVIIAVAWTMLRGVADQFVAAPMRSAAESLSDLGALSLSVVRMVAFVAAIIAIADYAVKRRELHKELKMSKQEIRQEAKDAEGDPHVRGRQRSNRMALSRNRMLQAVPDAHVVITNPTHLAIAIRYQPGEGAPRVVARGADALAAKIREAATRADVPLVESKPLAQVLYRVCRPGEEIPPELFQGVATVLAFLHRLGQTHRAYRGRLGLYVPDSWTPSTGTLERVPPARRRAREREALRPRPL